MKSIFEYMDYRKYLADYFAEQKQSPSGFSYRSFSDAIGFKTKDFIHRVIHGQKNLSLTSIEKISRALHHSKRESEYFASLVRFNQETGHDEKERYYQELTAIVKQSRYSSAPRILTHEQYRLFSEWYHLAIRSLIDVSDFRGDFAWLAKKVSPAITPARARKSVALLTDLGLVYREESGRYRINEKSITTGDEIAQHALHNFYLACLKHAASALDTVAREKRNISGLTVGISEHSYNRIVEKVAAFRREVAEIADSDQEADRVYQMNILLFPVSENNGDKDGVR